MADLSAAEKFPVFLQATIAYIQSEPDQVVLEMGAKLNICLMQEKVAPGFKASKERCTLLLGGNASGDYASKIKPLMIFDSEDP